MFSKNSFEQSRSARNIRGIFSFTEVNTKSNLPKMKSSGLRGYESRLSTSKSSTKGTWEDFLQRNLSPKEISSSTREIFMKVEEKAKKEISNYSRPLDSVGKSELVSKDIEVFKKSILSKKNQYNKLHHIVQTKEAFLAGLLNKLDEINASEDKVKDQGTLNTKISEYKNIEVELKNELAQKETLLHIIERAKADNISKTGPIIQMRKKLAEVKQENFTIEKTYMQTVSVISEIMNDFTKEEQEYYDLMLKRDSIVSAKSKLYEEKLKLKISIDKEKERNELLDKQKKDMKKLKDIEAVLENYKNIELLEEEILSIENFCVSEEEKFKTIQKVTNVKFVGDILAHYEYLMENKQKLIDSVSNALVHIEKLNKDRILLSKSLSNLKYQEDQEVLEISDIENAKAKYHAKCKYIENYENRLERLQQILIMAINTFSRVRELLKINKNVGKIRIENLLETITICYSTFVKIIDEINTRKEVAKEEQSSSKSLDLSFSEANSNQIYT
ncbi:hypothetical protein SteCoe_12966 [Stentor coeruleus]|uniref:Uncharacterized protein n=1 Tax=Stentor coeruleus TaxID=5963 RepID=A0A1R2C9K6_9CILI|nr:hypothetical protein SteCoe_12966 [Stentor coeruleus]